MVTATCLIPSCETSREKLEQLSQKSMLAILTVMTVIETRHYFVVLEMLYGVNIVPRVFYLFDIF